MSDIIFKTLLVKGENGGNIKDIKKTSTNGLVDTYTVTLTNGDTTTFKVTNGEGLQNLQVGGRNLYYLKDFSIVDKSRITNYSVENGEIAVTASGSDMFFGDVLLSEGATYQKEFGPLMYVEGASFVTLSISNPAFDKNYLTFFDKDKKSISYIMITSNVEKGLNVPSGAAYMILRAGNGNSVSGTTYKTRIKVERGNIPTDWTPALEDLTDTSIPNSDIDTILNS